MPSKALIAGAGIAGLAAGIALRKAGLEVEIFERAPDMREIGAGLSITPNGADALRQLGVEVKVLEVRRLALKTWRGQRLTDVPVDLMSKRYGFGFLIAHRADLRAGLVAAFDHSAGIRLAAEVVGFDDAQEKVRVNLQDGDSVDGDLLIGADGLRSAVRRHLLNDGPPVYLGSTIWRGVVSAQGLGLEEGAGGNWIGRGGEFIAFHMVGGRIYWAAVAKAAEGGRPGTNGHKEDLLRRFGDWDHPVRAQISATDEEAILRNDMYDRPPARTWTVGRVTLTGDSAHPMTPNAGQGANQALEDAVALGESLAGQTDIPAALMAYQRRRFARANRIVSQSRQAARATQLENGLLCALRDGIASRMPRVLLFRLMDATMAPPR